jgi:hypothetical protein
MRYDQKLPYVVSLIVICISLWALPSNATGPTLPFALVQGALDAGGGVAHATLVADPAPVSELTASAAIESNGVPVPSGGALTRQFSQPLSPLATMTERVSGPTLSTGQFQSPTQE